MGKVPECLGQLWNAMQLRDYVERVQLAVGIIKFKPVQSLTYFGCHSCKKRLLFLGICRFCLHECPSLKVFYRVSLKVEDKSCCLSAFAWESAKDFFHMPAADFAVLRSEGRVQPVLDALVGKLYVVTFSIAKGKDGPYIQIDKAEPITWNIPSRSAQSSYDIETTAFGEFSFSQGLVSDPILNASSQSQNSEHSPPYVAHASPRVVSREFVFAFSVGYTLGALSCCIVLCIAFCLPRT